MIFKPVRTPCIGICSTGIGDDVCRGCKRFSHEVIDWNSYSNDQRLAIVGRLQSFLAQVVGNYLEIVNKRVLEEQLMHQQIDFVQNQDPNCWVFALIKAGANQITDPSLYGFRVKPQHSQLTLVVIKQKIDEDYLLLSQAHFERYFISSTEEECKPLPLDSGSAGY